ncbi:hypothetical protein F5X68DRAFT_242486, partial [Plectosphaerella plurivora]
CRIRFSHALNPSVGTERKANDEGDGRLSKRRHAFPDGQRWMRTDRAFSFVDETNYIARLEEYQADGHDDTDAYEEAAIRSASSARSSPQSFPSSSTQPQVFGSTPVPAASSSLPHVSTNGHPAAEEGNSDLYNGGPSIHTEKASLEPDIGSEVIPDAPAPSKIIASSFSDLSLSDLFGLGVSSDFPSGLEHPLSLWSPQDLALVDGEGGTIYLDTPRWPLSDPEEAMLFRYYIDTLTPFFDMCDEEKHFARIVPLRAATCCPLFHAILAYAAKRLSRLGDYDSVVADKYHQKCLNALIPALSNSAAVADENLLTSLILLRSMEEIDAPISAPSPEFHLMGTRVFLEAQKMSCDFTGLRLASFWIAMRQEIYMAFIHSRPVRSDFALNTFEWLNEPDVTGCNTANRIIIYCAACLRYCYGSQEVTVEGWDELQGYLQEWWNERPWHYTPIYTDENDDGTTPGFLPDIRYYNSAVVTGIQHYHLAKMLLAAHSPNIPKLGFSRKRAFDSMNEEIKVAVRAIVGIAESNQYTPPAYVTASMAITMAGDCFTERSEQQVLYDVLMKTDKDLAWPTHSARQALLKSWGWNHPP